MDQIVGFPAPERARSIMLSTHQLLVEELGGVVGATPGSAPPEQSPTAALYGFVAVDAVPHLVSLGQDLGGDDVRPGPVLAVATGLDARIGELHLTGELGEWIYPSSDPRVAEALHEHRECMVDPVRDLIEVLRLRVAPIRVSGAWVRAPHRVGGRAENGVGGRAENLVAVDPADFAAARPDVWAAFAHEAMHHLHEHHHADLVELARTSGAPRCTAVDVTRLGPTGAILTAMGPDGLFDVVIPFDPPAATPSEAGRRLLGS